MEIVWNHTLRYRGQRIARDFNYAAPTANGQYTLTDTRDEVVFDWSNPQFSRAEDLNNISIWFVAYTSAPARRAGNVVLVHETLNMAKEGRKAWTYSPGTRRVRRAPNIAYDNPVTNGDGLGTLTSMMGTMEPRTVMTGLWSESRRSSLSKTTIMLY